MAKAGKKSPVKTVLKSILAIVIAALLVVGGYVAYVFIAYHRIGDNIALDVHGEAGAELEIGKEYRILSYNIGFAAYTADFGFFMDGGVESRARSEESVLSVMGGITEIINGVAADIAVIEEVDFDSDRSWHVDEREILANSVNDGYAHTFVQNYDSPYLFYPITCPHGASKSGIMTFSSFPITSSVRRELPVESGFMKLLDLDRCYSVSRLPVGEKELVIFSTHLSAYSSDGTLATEQLRILLNDMQSEYDRGNYVICAGDFNKDLIGKGSEIFNVTNEKYTWAQPIPEGMFDGRNLTLVAPFDEKLLIPSCRNADAAYYRGQYVITPDGFIVSDNVTVTASAVIDTGFALSDHNPVIMSFTLN